MMDTNFEFEILITVHNEDDSIIQKAVNHYSKYLKPIHLLDSSLHPRILDYGTNIMNHYSPSQNFLDKIIEYIPRVKSKYLFLLPVDDICCLENVIDSLNSIQLNSLVYVGGKFVTISGQDTVQCSQLAFQNTKSHLPMVQSEIYKNYRFPLLWGFYYKDALLRSFSLIKNFNFNNANFIELSLVAILPTLGDVYETENVFLYRSPGVNSWGRRNKTLTISSLLLLKKDQRSYLRLLSEMGILSKVLHYYIYYLVINSIKLSGIKLFLNKMMRKARLQ